MKHRRGDWWNDDPLDWKWLIPVAIAVTVFVLTAAMVIAQVAP